MAGLGLYAARRATNSESGSPVRWDSAARQLGLTPSTAPSAIPSHPVERTALLSGRVEGCAVTVELLELTEGRRRETTTRVVVSPAPRPPGDALPGEAARAAFLRLRFHGATASDRVIRVEEKTRLSETAIVSIVRAMVLLCSDEGRATLEAFVAGRAPEPPRPRGPWQTARLESAAELAQADALRFLVALHGYAACTEAISEALESGAEMTKCVAVAAIGKARDAVFLDLLAELSEHVGDPVAETIADALASLGDARAEPALLRLLRSGSGSVQRAAAAALGEVGTVRAVESLYALTGQMLPGALEATAREAIARIQARIRNAEAGRLSVHAEGPAEGGVSIAREEGGLSLDPSARDKK